MKLNKKGFTMIEILGAVAILAIVSGIAITSYTKYQEKVRQDAYEAMETSAFSAAQNYIQDKGLVVPVDPETKVIEVSTLVDSGYLNPLEDPRTKGDLCHVGSTVTVSKTKNQGAKLEEYKYVVVIKCNHYTSTREDASGNEYEGKIFNS